MLILESAQLISTAHHVFLSEKTDFNKIYKSTHINHLCSKWTRENNHNYC